VLSGARRLAGGPADPAAGERARTARVGRDRLASARSERQAVQRALQDRLCRCSTTPPGGDCARRPGPAGVLDIWYTFLKKNSRSSDLWSETPEIPVVFHYVVNVMLTKKLLHRRWNAKGSEFFCTNGSSLLVFQLYDVFQSSRCALASLSLANMERFVLIFSALLEQSRIETLVGCALS
jgi:hypothetical protein